eukprot:PhM_4_TR7566/c0_g1_i1/m.61697
MKDEILGEVVERRLLQRTHAGLTPTAAKWRRLIDLLLRCGVAQTVPEGHLCGLVAGHPRHELEVGPIVADVVLWRWCPDPFERRHNRSLFRLHGRQRPHDALRQLQLARAALTVWREKIDRALKVTFVAKSGFGVARHDNGQKHVLFLLLVLALSRALVHNDCCALGVQQLIRHNNAAHRVDDVLTQLVLVVEPVLELIRGAVHHRNAQSLAARRVEVEVAREQSLQRVDRVPLPLDAHVDGAPWGVPSGRHEHDPAHEVLRNRVLHGDGNDLGNVKLHGHFVALGAPQTGLRHAEEEGVDEAPLAEEVPRVRDIGAGAVGRRGVQVGVLNVGLLEDKVRVLVQLVEDVEKELVGVVLLITLVLGI